MEESFCSIRAGTDAKRDQGWMAYSRGIFTLLSTGEWSCQATSDHLEDRDSAGNYGRVGPIDFSSLATAYFTRTARQEAVYLLGYVNFSIADHTSKRLNYHRWSEMDRSSQILGTYRISWICSWPFSSLRQRRRRKRFTHWRTWNLSTGWRRDRAKLVIQGDFRNYCEWDFEGELAT